MLLPLPPILPTHVPHVKVVLLSWLGRLCSLLSGGVFVRVNIAGVLAVLVQAVGILVVFIDLQCNFSFSDQSVPCLNPLHELLQFRRLRHILIH